jgi:hypothetical protein
LEDAKGALEKTKADQAEFDRSITLNVDIGAILKSSFAISPSGIVWQGHRVALKDVTQIRWGGTRHSVNGIPTGTTFDIYFGTAREIHHVHLLNGESYSKIIDCLWRAVGVRLMFDCVTTLREGGRIQAGDGFIADQGVTLVRRVFSAPTKAYWYLEARHTFGVKTVIFGSDRKPTKSYSFSCLIRRPTMSL